MANSKYHHTLSMDVHHHELCRRTHSIAAAMIYVSTMRLELGRVVQHNGHSGAEQRT